MSSKRKFGSLSKESLVYLRSRGYSEKGILRDGVKELPKGNYSKGKGSVSWFNDSTKIAIFCRSLSERDVGVILIDQKADKEKRYNFQKADKSGHLPMMLSCKRDRDLIFDGRDVILVEGVFDRACVWEAKPDDVACVARLSVGLSNPLVDLFSVYKNRVWLMFDNDEAGKSTTKKNLLRFRREGLNLEEISYVGGKDPAEVVERYGVGKLKDQITSSLSEVI